MYESDGWLRAEGCGRHAIFMLPQVNYFLASPEVTRSCVTGTGEAISAMKAFGTSK
jgi:hypothetical protein